MKLTDRGSLLTEQPNPASQQLGQMSPEAFVQLMNEEDQKAVQQVTLVAPVIAEAIRQVSARLRQGGRLFYVGAGTSGRLGVLDAAECPPTFCTDPDLVQGIIAGGVSALTRSVEGAEDDEQAGRLVMTPVTAADAVLGITAGGTTPFVHGALAEARRRGTLTLFFTCVSVEEVPARYDLEIRPLVGPEVLTGSTRLKAGTATKLVLNMLSTGVMVQLGKVYGNLMVDVAVTNEKLRDRAVRILMRLTTLDRSACESLLVRAENRVKVALVMHHRGLDSLAARDWLAARGESLMDLTEKGAYP
ncbi:N-acetylmuramic acid 6-phosphate etherase [Candidatus Cyanaurora vandensis]|uniref:N-acetylmuramic acid 6-phosphate etherase n=1 Tax=Candidatus Cyanaurora vandensis TaxID=2714958 RepID=UPI00257C97C4|nr:N-acetylmuramic acid 6-phosphate etherase [Candidatus Cyanaurora vandensis]